MHILRGLSKIVLTLITIIQLLNVSAYTPFECGGSRLTASGEHATEGITVAADHLPFGTIVEIFGKQYVVQDRFGGGYTNRLDIFMESYEDAINFGRQWIEVKIIRPN